MMKENNPATDRIMQIIRFRSHLSYEEVIEVAREREGLFKIIPGLIEKYYVKSAEGEFGGIYIWDSKKSLEDFRSSDLARTIPKAYKLVGAPDIEVLDLVFALRD